MRKYKNIFLIFILMISIFLTSCKTSSNTDINVVCASYSEFDWARNISKGVENINISYLTSSGISLHDYSLTIKDTVKIIDSDIFIYVGGESDIWCSEVIKNSKKSQISISMLDTIETKLIEDNSDEDEYDEHVWLSIKNAKLIIKKICDAFVKIDNNHKEIYELNYNNYLNELENLDKNFKTTIENHIENNQNLLVFSGRFPFKYLFNDYNLNYNAAFLGCSLDSSVNPNVIIELSNTVKENNIKTLLKIEADQINISSQIKNISKLTLNELTLNSMQIVKESDSKNISYIDVMKNNLEIIDKALNY